MATPTAADATAPASASAGMLAAMATGDTTMTATPAAGAAADGRGAELVWTKVAVKVLHPGVRSTVMADLDLLRLGGAPHHGPRPTPARVGAARGRAGACGGVRGWAWARACPGVARRAGAARVG